jgi:hypothetical protein
MSVPDFDGESDLAAWDRRCPGPVIGPNTDGEPCDWSRLCGERPADHAPIPPEDAR